MFYCILERPVLEFVAITAAKLKVGLLRRACDFGLKLLDLNCRGTVELDIFYKEFFISGDFLRNRLFSVLFMGDLA